MSAIASQITSLTIVYSTVYSRRSSKKTPKPRVTGLCEGNSPGNGEFLAQRASNAEMFPFNDVIMDALKQKGLWDVLRGTESSLQNIIYETPVKDAL